ncbi:ATP-binding protein [Romboutsia sp.]|uniref:ATP-binding protein n=1 Tax=Romboutsia sp. TaxID=1965302 RepID=UPI003F3FA39C
MKKSEELLEEKTAKEEYRCAKCSDMTFVIVGNEAIPCECREVRLAEEILLKSGISEEFRKKRFDNFNYGRDKQISNAYKEAYLYGKNFKAIEKERCNSIMFMGQVGSGKTHLSLAIANELMDNGVGVVYMSYREVITRLKQNIMDEVYYHRVMGRYKGARVLVIDDLFKGKVTESDINIVFELLNFRYFNRLPVIVSCEIGVDGVIKIDEAIGSRLYEMCRYVEVKGKRLNYRMYV